MITVSGRVDSVTAADLEQAVLAETYPGCRVALSMAEVNYLSSAGLRALLLIYRTVVERGGQLALVGLSEHMHDVMSITGFIDHFEVFETVGDALAYFAADS